MKHSRIYLFFKKLFFLFGLVFFSLVLFSNLIVFFTSYGHIYSNVDNVPHKQIGLVLGTSKYISGGSYNLFYDLRLKSASELIFKKKVDTLLLSGSKDGLYNEPEKMKNDLLKMGVNENQIKLDYNGFRTLDSVVRAKEVYGYNDFVIVSQVFHTQRALFIARIRDIDAIGFGTGNPPFYKG